MRKKILILSTQLLICIVCSAQKVDKDCPKPNKDSVRWLCRLTENKKADEDENSRFNHLYESVLEKMACVGKTDPIEVARIKVQNFWNKYHDDCKCKMDDFLVVDGNILKYAVQNNFEDFILVITETYNLNLNFIDPADGKTVLDFTSDQLELYKLNPNSQTTKSFQRIYNLLKSNGALHAKELSK